MVCALDCSRRASRYRCAHAGSVPASTYTAPVSDIPNSAPAGASNDGVSMRKQRPGTPTRPATPNVPIPRTIDLAVLAVGLEAVFTLLTIANQRIPPTINYQVPDPAIPLDVVANVARDARVRHAISNSFGFGGQNVSLVIAGEPA